MRCMSNNHRKKKWKITICDEYSIKPHSIRYVEMLGIWFCVFFFSAPLLCDVCRSYGVVVILFSYSSRSGSLSHLGFISSNFESLNHHLSNQLIMEFTLAICVHIRPYCVCTQFAAAVFVSVSLSLTVSNDRSKCSTNEDCFKTIQQKKWVRERQRERERANQKENTAVTNAWQHLFWNKCQYKWLSSFFDTESYTLSM